MKTLLWIALGVALIAGCASPHEAGRAAMERGDFRVAEQELITAARRGDGAAWNDLGVLYHRQGKIQAAIDAFNMAARHGDPTARATLARNKLPVPAPDLAQRPPPAASDGLAAGLQGFNRGYAPAPTPAQPDAINLDCTARQTSMGPAAMNRTYNVQCR